ncbi:hypothetical protein [Methanochimaera problematica]|nr:hypothetical protein [Methanoplanus sp. FWC-SCC4]
MAIWHETGFIPPAEYANLVEFLHQMNMYEDNHPIDILKGMSGRSGFSANASGCASCIITDREKMYGYAEKCGISRDNKSDSVIAEEICLLIIADYEPEVSGHSFNNKMLYDRLPDRAEIIP